jgi:hypothetical protein
MAVAFVPGAAAEQMHTNKADDLFLHLYGAPGMINQMQLNSCRSISRTF